MPKPIVRKLIRPSLSWASIRLAYSGSLALALWRSACAWTTSGTISLRNGLSVAGVVVGVGGRGVRRGVGVAVAGGMAADAVGSTPGVAPDNVNSSGGVG